MTDRFDNALLPRSFEVGFDPTPWICYASLFVNTRGRCQPSGANSKVGYNVGNWRSSPPLRRETAVAMSSEVKNASYQPCSQPLNLLQMVDISHEYWRTGWHSIFKVWDPNRFRKILEGAPCQEDQSSCLIHSVSAMNRWGECIVSAEPLNF